MTEPTSLLTIITETKTVSGRRAARSASAVTVPSASGAR